MIAWFGIRGIGSLYYLCYALHHGLPPDLAPRLTALTLAVVAVSIVVHGLSVTPLMTSTAPGRPAPARPPHGGGQDAAAPSGASQGVDACAHVSTALPPGTPRRHDLGLSVVGRRGGGTDGTVFA